MAEEDRRTGLHPAGRTGDADDTHAAAQPAAADGAGLRWASPGASRPVLPRLWALHHELRGGPGHGERSARRPGAVPAVRVDTEHLPAPLPARPTGHHPRVKPPPARRPPAPYFRPSSSPARLLVPPVRAPGYPTRPAPSHAWPTPRLHAKGLPPLQRPPEKEPPSRASTFSISKK